MGRRIELQTSEPFKDLGKAIPGAYWRERSRRWSLPLGMAVCRNIREVFGDQLQIGPRLAEWAKAETASEKHQRGLGRSLAGVEMPGVAARAPRLAQAMQARPYQSNAALFLAHGGTGLLADTPGLGKTTEAIAGVIESGVQGPFLVAAPVAAMSDAWEREIAVRLGEDARVVVVTGSKANRERLLHQAFHEGDRRNLWVIVNIEMMRTRTWWVCPECGDRWEASDKPKSSIVDCGHNPLRVDIEKEHQYPILFDLQWGALIMDECQRSLLRNSGKPTQTRKGAMLLETTGDGLRIAISGTPMRGKPQRLWGVLNWLNRAVYSGYWSWVERFWTVSDTGYGGAKVIGAFREDRRMAFEADLDRYMIRRTKQEVSPDLPPKAYMGTPLDVTDPNSPTAVWLRMDPKQEKAYMEMMTISAANVENGKLQAVGILAEMTRLKQLASTFGRITVDQEFRPAFPSNKWNWTEQFLRELNLLDPADADDEPQGKVVIVSQFTSILNLIAEQLRTEHKTSVAMVTGDVTGGKRQRMIDAFNRSAELNIMLLNTQAGGVALTLDSADDMIFFDETHVPDDQEQAEDRINNRRPEEKVATRRYWYLKSLGSIDEGIARTNLYRDADQKQHLDGRRGVEYAREVFATLKSLAERGR